MLQPRTAYTTEEQLMMVIKDWCAWDKEAGIHMSASRGRRMSGRATRYVVGFDKFWGHIRLTAESVAEAIEKANKRIAKGDLRAEGPNR